ncbi:MAG: right-handed parallel beta-helix repeat-containing protein [Deltaproteobacteria bacterium]|nr:right-handed parallel beta-helix repeat-containing protein [Deltaproteobacteria bacterium]
MNRKTYRFWQVWLMVMFSLPFILYSEKVAAATTYYIDDDGCPGQGAGTMGDPFCSIQDGINAAVSGDTVLVAAGTYYENITMKSGVVIQGEGQDVTTIDGGENASVVTAFSVNSAAKLDGFTITNGNSGNGGGIYNWFFSSPIVTNCTFSGNSATSYGGGIYNFNSSPTVTNCTFSGNTAGDSGGGIYNHNSSPTVTNCTFSGNLASFFGGGIYNNNSSPTITNCTFSENSVASTYYQETKGGGGMHNEYSSPTVTNCTFSGNSTFFNGGGMANINSFPTVTNCTFSGNSAYYYGGGIYNSYSSPTVTNCTFFGNTAIGGVMYNENSSSPTLTNSILWGNDPEGIFNSVSSTASVTYSDIQGGYTGTGNINADPMFVDQGNGGLHLQQDSPCIDAGDNSAPSLPTTDFDGDDRKIDDPKVADTGNGTPPIVDMGMDEYVPDPAPEFPWEIFYPAFIKKK